MKRKISLFNEEKITYKKFLEIFQGWSAYAKWANSYKLSESLITEVKPNQII